MTDLPLLFTKILTSGAMAHFPISAAAGPTDAYRELLHALKESPRSKILCEASHTDDLARLSATGLMLADTVVVSGAGRGEVQLTLPGPNAVTTGKIEVNEQLAKKQIFLGTFGFPKKTIDAWAEEARDFIVRGRLLYIPSRVAMWIDDELEDGRRHWQVDHVVFDTPAGTWRLRGLGAIAGAAVLRTDRPELPRSDSQVLEATTFALPTLGGLSLRALSKVLLDEEDAYIRFRAELQKGLREYLGSLPAECGPEEVRGTGVRYRAEVIDPEVAQLRQRLKRIVAMRSLRIVGATISTAGLAITALSNSGLLAGISAISSSAAGKALLDEIAQFRGEISSLRESPWYFGMLLKR